MKPTFFVSNKTYYSLFGVNLCALSQNSDVKKFKIKSLGKPIVKYSPQDSSTLRQELKEIFTDVDFTALTETQLGEIFQDLYAKYFYKGNRAITNIRKAAIRESKEKFYAASITMNLLMKVERPSVKM